MNEWTEQEEQQIIERAKTGDPEANYALSLWALRRGEEEPDEPRWNRLAAKCLVKSAQAGYGPAKEQMAALLSQGEQSSAPTQRTAPPAQPAAQKQPAADTADNAEEDEDASYVRPAPARRNRPAPRQTSTARRPASRRQRLTEEDDDEGFDVEEASWDDGEDDEDVRPAWNGRRSGLSWGDDKWRRMEFICVAVCAVLLVVIAVMILTGKRGGENSNNSNASIPPAGEVAPAAGGDAATGSYPDEATKSAIMAADLDIQPSPEDYVTEVTSGTVSVSSEYLRLRKGPNVTYDPIAQMPNGTAVSVFAKKNDWDLILYQGDDGPVYGWCSSEYVILTAGGVTGTAATDDPGDAVG